ncbi:hypothetical protein AN634_15225 (plasmid) [Lactiplantibacillus plantarum]|nr:hypothetical protein AN634_15225 [Lactiplantibacillus plantarum]
MKRVIRVTVDNDGLTKAPAFVDLKTQVDNSAVGTNLLLKTHEPFSITGTNIVNQAQQMYASSRELEVGTTVTLSFDAISTASTNIIIQNSGGVWMSLISTPLVPQINIMWQLSIWIIFLYKKVFVCALIMFLQQQLLQSPI